MTPQKINSELFLDFYLRVSYLFIELMKQINYDFFTENEIRYSNHAIHGP